jgi:diguanylate cyclase (GGDEF)-like protein
VEQRRLLDENLELKGLVNLYQVSQTIANCLELERLYKLVIDALAKEVNVARGAGFFLEDDKLVLKELKQLPQVDREKFGELLAPYLKSTNRNTEYLVAPAEKLLFNGLGITDVKEVMVLFIRSKVQLQGVILFFSERGQEFRREINAKNIHFLLEQSSLACDNAVRFATARNLANIDELTGLYNYRFLDIALDREIKRTERYGSYLSLIFLDLDLFKKVNDTHGHLIGSKVLREVGLLLKNLTREVDFVFRYGGDEYTIILVETGMAGAASVAERIRMSIESHQFLASDGYNIRITASLGYSCFPDDSRSKIELLELADKAMYKGKISGKNIVLHISAKDNI